MALCRFFINSNISKLFIPRNNISKCDLRLVVNTGHTLLQERSFRKGYGRILRVMKHRRKLAGPDRIRKRSEFDNWNYKAELYSFTRRLHESISEETLRCAFIHESYITKEEQKRKELDIPLQDVQLDMKPNTDLISSGKKILSDFSTLYLRHYFRLLPEEGIIALCDYLSSDEVLAYVSSNIGTKDLILSAEYPPEESTLATTLLAVVGSIAKDDSYEKAENFVLDFICMQLISKDIFEIWNLENPSSVLDAILERHGMEKYEPRLIFESGRNTIEAVYSIGLYSDKMFLGRGTGETLAIAEEMAAYNSLRKLFEVRESEKPFSSRKISKEDLLERSKPNPSIENWFSDRLKSDVYAITS